MKKQEVYTVQEALKKLMRYCVYRERCHKEVNEKLRHYQLTSLEKQEVISRLIADDFLNEERFAIAFTRDKFNLQNWGQERIKAELKQRQISDYLIRKALKEIDKEEYIATFEKLYQKRLLLLKDQPLLQKKKKLRNYLVRKGYEYELITQALNLISH